MGSSKKQFHHSFSRFSTQGYIHLQKENKILSNQQLCIKLVTAKLGKILLTIIKYARGCNDILLILSHELLAFSYCFNPDGSSGNY